VKQYGEKARFFLVFHGGSGSELRDIHEAIDYGVIKMNIGHRHAVCLHPSDRDHMLKHYDGRPEGRWRGGEQEDL